MMAKMFRKLVKSLPFSYFLMRYNQVYFLSCSICFHCENTAFFPLSRTVRAYKIFCNRWLLWSTVVPAIYEAEFISEFLLLYVYTFFKLNFSILLLLLSSLFWFALHQSTWFILGLTQKDSKLANIKIKKEYLVFLILCKWNISSSKISFGRARGCYLVIY